MLVVCLDDNLRNYCENIFSITLLNLNSIIKSFFGNLQPNQQFVS